MSLLDLMFLMQNEKTVKSFHDIYIYMQIITQNFSIFSQAYYIFILHIFYINIAYYFLMWFELAVT